MSASASRDWIVTHLADHLCQPVDRVVDDVRLTEDLGADSLDRIEYAMAIEEHFAVELTDDECVAATTVGALVATVDARIAEQGRVG